MALTRPLLAAALAVALTAVLAVGAVAQIKPDSGDAAFNPALLAISPRTRLEVGLGADLAGFSNGFALGEILQEVWTIDVNRVSEKTGRRGLVAGAALEAGSHTVFRFLGIGVGGYTRTRSVGLLTVPPEFLSLLADGNLEDRSGVGAAAVRSTVELGAAVTVDYGGWTFALGAGQAVPIAWSGDGGFVFDVRTTESGFAAEAGVDLIVFSAVDLIAAQGGGGLGIGGALGRGAFKVDLGAVRRDAAGLPVWGVGLTDLTIVRATAAGAYRLTGAYSASMEDAVQQLLDDPDSDPVELTMEEFTLTPIGASGERIALAPRISGFYRFSVPWVDFVPHAEVVFDREVGGISPGLTIAGNRFPANIVSLGLARTHPAWRAALGLRLPLRPVELNLRFETTSPRLGGLFGPEGLRAAIDLRFGW